MKLFFLSFLPLLLIIEPLSGSVHEHMGRGQRAYDSGLYDEAANAFEQALEEAEEAERADLFIRLAYAYHQCGRCTDAIEALQGVEDNAEVRFLLALAHKQLGHLAKAEELFSCCPQPLAQWHLAHIAYLQGNETDAETLWKNILSSGCDPQLTAMSALYFAKLDLSAGRYNRAREQLKALESQLYHTRSQTLNLDCAKAPGLTDHKSVHISNIDQLMIDQPRELSRWPKSKFVAECGITSPLAYECAFYLGAAEEERQDWQQAAEAYRRALPQRNPAQAAWVPNTLKRLAHCHMELAEKARGIQRVHQCAQAEAALRQLQSTFPIQDSQLALAALLIRKGRLLNDANSLAEANALLSDLTAYDSHLDRNQVLLLRAQASPNYETRRFFFKELLQRQEQNSPEYVQCLLHCSQNDLQEGQYRAALQKLEQASVQSPEILLEIARINALMHNPEARENGLAAVRQINDHPDPDLPYLLEGILLSQTEDEDPSVPWAKAVETYPEGRYADECLRQLGIWHYQKGRFADASQIFLDLVARYPSSPSCGEALYWMARAQENLGASRASQKQQLREVYQNYPQSPYAPEAYLACYTYLEYLNEPEARIHLQTMKGRFPDSPLVINAQHLLGLSLRRLPPSSDKRKSPTSRWHQAIEAFQEAESTFERLFKAGLIPDKDLPRCATLRCRAKLERALANLAIASDALGAKKRIYLGYTSDLFRELVAELDQAPWKNEALDPIREEAAYGLVVALIRSGDFSQADTLTDELLERYKSNSVSRGYFLSRTLYQKGSLQLHAANYADGLAFFQQAEETAKGNLLSPEEKLDLWLAQSHCLKQLNRLDEAMLVLSKVINEDAISSLRVKAMFLRAELYQQQGRHELAQKQLEATARKGGEWAAKAKDKLAKDYGFN